MRIRSKHFRALPLLVGALLALAVWAPLANAQRNCPGGGSNNPPGNSEIDQYSEDVPGPCGDQPVNPPSGGSDSPPGSSLPSGTAADLNSLGADGQAAAALAEATAPRNQGSDSDGGSGTDGSGATGEDIASGAEGGSIFDELFGAITGSAGGDDDGVGLLLPLILAAVLLAAIAYGLRRRFVE